MEIKTRREAMKAGENKYFTGIICKNGHMAFRYVQSGCCYDCINSKRITATGKQDLRLAEVADKIRTADLIKSNLLTVRFRLHDEDKENFATTVWATVVLRYPSIFLENVTPALVAKDKVSGTALYAFRCHPDDIEQLRKIADVMLKQKKFDVETARRKAREGYSKDNIDPLPDWALRP